MLYTVLLKYNIFFQNFTTNFGVSYQDLSIFNRYDPFNEPLSKSSPLTDAFLRKKHGRQLSNSNSTIQPHSTNPSVNLDLESGYFKSSIFRDGNVSHAASVPNLLQTSDRLPVDIQDSVVNVSSVPKDLNFIGEFNSPVAVVSVAEKNLNLADLDFDKNSAKSETLVCTSEPHHTEPTLEEHELLSLIGNSEEATDMANYKREGSYSEAMSNRVDLSDDEGSLRYKKKLPKSPIVEFDRRVLKAISEQSLQSLVSSTNSLHDHHQVLKHRSSFASSTPTKRYQNRSVAVSTPDLNRIEPVVRREKDIYMDDDRRKSVQEISASRYDTSTIEQERNKNILLDESDLDVPRKGSIIKSSTSTSGMSDIEDKTLRQSVKSFTGSNGSKGKLLKKSKISTICFIFVS